MITNHRNIKKKAVAFLIAFISIAGIFFIKDVSSETFYGNLQKPIRVGYFHGGRTALLMRAYENHEFQRDGVEVQFFSKNLRDKEYYLLPETILELLNTNANHVFVSKVKGTELVDGIMEGQFDIATIGESSFLYAIYSGSPIVAIAKLGHDVKGHPAHVFLMRKGLNIDKPQDYFGKLMVSRRAGPVEDVFLKEFLCKQGIDINKDVLELDALPKTMKEKEKLPKNKVIIVPNLDDDVMKQEARKNNIIDGGYFHIMGAQKLAYSKFKITRPLDYVCNPELSHAILVCHKDFLRDNRERLVKFIETYIKRIRYEHSLSYEERTKKQPKGMQIAIDFHGFDYPQYDIIPTSSAELLYQMANLLKKYKAIDNKDIKIEDFIDNSLVLEAAANLGITEKDDYQPPEY